MEASAVSLYHHVIYTSDCDSCPRFSRRVPDRRARGRGWSVCLCDCVLFVCVSVCAHPHAFFVGRGLLFGVSLALDWLGVARRALNTKPLARAQCVCDTSYFYQMSNIRHISGISRTTSHNALVMCGAISCSMRQTSPTRDRVPLSSSNMHAVCAMRGRDGGVMIETVRDL